MGFEVEIRRVPPDWQHPIGEDGKPQRLLRAAYAEEQHWHDKQFRLWEEGLVLVSRDPERWEMHPWAGDDDHYFKAIEIAVYEEANYMPRWPEKETTHFQVYVVGLGLVPISPVVATMEEAAKALDQYLAVYLKGGRSHESRWLLSMQQGRLVEKPKPWQVLRLDIDW